MKIRGEDGVVENVKMVLCEDCNRWVIKLGDKELDSLDLLGYNYQILEIGIAEMAAFNNFIGATREMVIECIEYYQGKLDALQEMNDEIEKGKQDEGPDEKNNQN